MSLLPQLPLLNKETSVVIIVNLAFDVLEIITIHMMGYLQRNVANRNLFFLFFTNLSFGNKTEKHKNKPVNFEVKNLSIPNNL